jgi:two-component system, cell cycle sensor histidine kinase and response regulator CckA
MFEPFWSTKQQQGGGTGLGLAAVAGIVAQHGWVISVDSEPEVGTAVSVYMPLARETSTSSAAVDDQSTLETVPARSA